MKNDIIRLQIEGQLNQEDDLWRIGRRSTWADLIIVSFYDYQRTQDSIYLLRTICNCVRIQLLDEIGGLPASLNAAIYEAEPLEKSHRNLLVDRYFKQIENTTHQQLDVTQQLYEQIQYLKVINQELEDDSHDNDVYTNIARLAIAVLKEM